MHPSQPASVVTSYTPIIHNYCTEAKPGNGLQCNPEVMQISPVLCALKFVSVCELFVCVCVCVCVLNCVQLFATPWTVACQAPLSMGFPRQEYWSGLRFPPPRDLPNPGNELKSPALQADSLPLSHQGRSEPQVAAVEVCRFIQSCRVTITIPDGLWTRRSGEFSWRTFAKIKAPDEGISCFLRSLFEL